MVKDRLLGYPFPVQRARVRVAAPPLSVVRLVQREAPRLELPSLDADGIVLIGRTD